MLPPTLPPRLQAALGDFAAGLRSRLGERVEGVRLFGSWARGEARPDSDVDVWVLVDRFDPLTRRLPFDLAVEVFLRHGVDLSPTVMEQAEWRLLRDRERRIARDIEAQGVPL